MTIKPPILTHTGKQVLYDGAHFADAATEFGAEQIVSSMSARASIAEYLDREASKRTVPAMRRMLAVLASNIRAKLDEADSANS